MLFHPFLLGLLYLGFFELYFLFTNNRLLLWIYFIALVIYTAVRLMFHVGEALVRRWVLVTFFLLLFVFVTMYVSVIEVSWLRHVGGIGFSVFTSFLALLLSTGKGDIRARPRSFVSAIVFDGSPNWMADSCCVDSCWNCLFVVFVIAYSIARNYSCDSCDVYCILSIILGGGVFAVWSVDFGVVACDSTIVICDV